MAEKTPQEIIAEQVKARQVDTLNRVGLAGYAQANGIDVSQTLDHLMSQSTMGATSNIIGNSYWGFNHRNTPTPIPINRDGVGMVFFTRPDFNMDTSNIRHHRMFNAFQTKEQYSLPRIFRNTFDPDLAKGDNYTPAITCPVVDNLQAFIPILSNTCLSCSGFEDTEAPTTTTKAGAYGEAMTWTDGTTRKLGNYDITTTHRNVIGDPITLLPFYWVEYMSAVRQGIMVPKFKNIFERRIDYQTRIYRLILDHTKTYVQKIACTGASQPKYSPIGASFNFEAERPFNSSNDQISLTWTGHGLYYMDDFIIRAFNKTAVDFNPNLAPDKRRVHYQQIPIQALPLFNHLGYPFIIPETKELSWWVTNELFQKVMSGLSIGDMQVFDINSGD